jgi:hypothetical protein
VKARIVELLEDQRGFAMVLALLITLVMTLLGMAFLLMSETENRIAENERTSAQALYFAEAGVRVVESWFDTDFPSGALMPPTAGVIDLTRREIDDGDPSTPTHFQDGGTWPRYKQNVDLDFDGSDDLFRRPFRGGPGDLRHALLGTKEGPDISIDAASPLARTYLDSFSEALVPAYPAGGAAGVRARISRIDLYAPPYVDLNGAWTRHGMATIAVEATILRTVGGADQVLARRTVKAVLNEIPYYAARAPLQSGGPVTYNGDLKVHWGPLLAAGTGDLSDPFDARIPASHPRDLPGGLNVDLVWGHAQDGLFLSYKTHAEGGVVPDPWFRYFGTGPILDAPNASVQPEPYVPPPDPDDTVPADHSNLFQNLPLGAAANFNYDLWKQIATSKRRGLHYYVWVDGSSFSENGTGPEKTFVEITDGQEGVFFFDTRDRKAPEDGDGDGRYDNLTPPIIVNGGTWGTRGLIYLNCERIQVKNVTGRPATFNAPGEVFQDKNPDGHFDPAVENWLNLTYPTTLTDPFVLTADDALQDDGTMGTIAVRNRIGPTIDDNAAVWGIFFNSGTFDASGGNATFYGSVVAESGIVQTEPGTPAPDIYWDDRLPTEWPPATWTLPRVAVARWVTE